MRQPAYYARPGSVMGDLLAILHPPYTAWHLSYVVMGAAIATTIDPIRLAGTVAAFAFGTGIGAHALDELHSRPLGTRLSRRALIWLTATGFGAALAVSAVGIVVISPWVVVWAVVGTFLALGYAAEWSRWLHSDPGFAVAWGAFPVLTGFWAQTEGVTPSAVLLATAAALLSMAQRRLSTPARYVRRSTLRAEVTFDTVEGTETWSRSDLLTGWESPLRILSWAMVVLSVGLLLART